MPLHEVSAGVASGAFVQLYDNILGTAAASFDITGIPADYAHLIVVLYARGDTAATNTAVLVTFNGDTGANYDAQRTEGAGATVAAGENLAATSMNLGDISASTATANRFAEMTYEIPQYAGTTGNKVIRAKGGFVIGTATGNVKLRDGFGNWRSTAAINRVTLAPSAGNFIAGSRCSVYAIGVA